MVGLDRGALNFGGQSLQSPYDAAIVYTTPVVPAAPVQIRIPRRVLGGTDEIHLLLSLESLQEGVGPTDVVVTATRSGTAYHATAPRDIAVPLVVVDGTTSRSDYSVSGTQTITIRRGQVSGTTTLTVTAVDDFTKETRVEEVRIEGGTAPEVVYGASMNIIDAPSIVLTAAPVRIAEEGGAQTVTVTAALGDPSDSVRPRAIPVALTWGGTAGSGDYAVVGERVTIDANARTGSATVTITPTDDRLLEGDETIVLRGSTAGLLVEGTTLTLADDEEVPAVSLAVSRDRVLESDGARTVTVSATLDPEVAMANDTTTVNLELMGTATRGTDYTRTWSPATPRISIPLNATVGSSTVALTLTPLQDEVAEGDETIVVEGTATTGSRELVVKVAKITLQDDDVRGVEVEPTRLTIDEGSSDRYSLRLTSKPTGDVRVSVGVPADAPLAVLPPSVTFTADDWSTAQTVTVTVEADADAVMHDDVELTHAVGGADYGGRVTAAPVTVTLRETTVPEVTIADGAADEDGGAVTFLLSMDVESDEEVRAPWRTAEGTATSGVDFTGSSGTVNFAPRTTAAAITVPILDDELDEADETFTVSLSAPANAALGDGEATGTIRDDDDAPELTLSGPAAAATEGEDTSLEFTAELSAASGRVVTVGYAAAAGTAAAPGDFTAPASGARLTFAPGDRQRTITIPVIDDTLDEAEETFTVRLSSASGATLGTVAATGRILDDDDEPELEVADATADEDAGPLEFAVTLSAESGRTVTVAYATSDGTAEEPDDYTESTGTLTFTAGTTKLTVEVPVVNDQEYEADETLTLTLSSLTNAEFGEGGSAATGTIADDDLKPTVTVVSPTWVWESAGTLGFKVKLSAAIGRPVTMKYATSDATATAPEDYLETTGTLTFAPGEKQVTVQVPVVDDADDEMEFEAFKLTLSDAVNAVFAEDDFIGPGTTFTQVGPIRDDDDPVVEVTFGAAAYTASEGGSPVTVTVSVDKDPERELTIPLTAAHAGGTMGEDYTGVPEEVVFESGGALFRTFAVTAVDDEVDDDGERVELAFGTLPARVTRGDTDESVVTLKDDDERGVEASVTGLSVNEHASTSYTVVLASEPTAAVTVTVTGTDGTDLTAPSEGLKLTFTTENWDTAQTVAVTAADDTDVLADPVVELAHGVTGGDYGLNAVTGPTVRVTIVENDTATVNVTDVTVAEDGGPAEFTVTLSEESSAAVTLAYATSDGTAEEPADYTAASGTLTFTAPVTKLTVRVAVIDDTVDEAEEETFTLTLSGVAQAGFAGGGTTLAAQGTIADDDDPAVEVTFGAAAYSAPEGGAPVTVTVSVDKDPERDLVIPLRTTDGTGVVAADYSGVPAEVRFAAGGELSRSFAVTAEDDDVDEDDETVSLGFGTVARVTAGSPGATTVTLTDDDTRGVTVTPEALTIAEGSSGTYTVVLDSEPTADVTVTIGGSANTVLTVAPSGLGLAFTAANWDTAQTVTLTAASDMDAVVPPAVTLTHAVAGGDYAAAAAAAVTVRVTELTVPVLTLSPTAASVSESVGGSGQSLTVTLSVASSETVTVGYATADGTAAAGADYTSTTGTLTFAPEGALTQTIGVPILADVLDEADETFAVRLSSPVNATLGASSSATVTVTDDDPLPEVSIAGAFKHEGQENLTVTVTLSAASGRPVQVSYASRDGRAAAGADYGAVGGELRFEPDTTSRTLTVTITDDALHEGIFEDFYITLSDPVNAVLGSSATGRFLIYDNDDEPILNLSPTTATVAEGGVVTFTAELSEAGGLPVNFEYQTTDGTAQAAGDYAGTGGSTPLVIPAGDTRRQFVVSTTDDTLDEDAETFMVRIRQNIMFTFGAELGDDDRATVTITDNDDPPEVGALDVTAREDAGSLDFSVGLDAASGKTVTVEYAVTAGTATAGEDFTAVPSGTLTFAVGTTAQTVSVPLLDDDVHEPDETVALTLSAPTNATVGDGSASGTIRDDAAVPVVALGLDPSEIDEDGGESVVTASLSGKSSQTVTVTVATAAVVPAVSGDFMQSGATLTIATGATASTGTVRVRAVNNDVDAPDKTVTVTGTASGGNGVADPSARTLTIRDDEVTPVVTLSLSDAAIEEDGGESVVTASLSGKSSQAVTVEVAAEPGTGASSGDFTLSGATLTIAAGATASTGTVQVTAVNNDVDTPDKTVTVRGAASGGNGVAAPSDVTLTVQDDDQRGVTVAPTAVTVEEGDEGTYTVVLKSEPTAEVEVAPSRESGSSEVSVSPASLTFTASDWADEQTVTVSAGQDLDPLDDSAVIGHTVSGGDYGGETPSGVTVMVKDDEVASTVIALSVDPADVSEGAGATGVTVTVTASLNSGTRSSETTVTVTVGSGTATSGTDFTAVADVELTIAANALSGTGTFTLRPTQDTVDEPDEMVAVGGTTTVSTLSVTPTAVTITDDDGTPTVTLELTDSISEDGGVATVTAKLSHASSAETTVAVSAVAVLPAVAADFRLSANKMLTIAAGATTSSGAVTIEGVDNDVDAADKSVTVTGEAANTQGEMDPAAVTLTIADDDTRRVDVDPTMLAVPEGGEKSYTVVLESEPTGDVEVTVTRKDGGSGDVTVSLGSLTFTATTWEEAQTVKVSAVHDLDAVSDTATIEHGVSGGDYGSESADEVAVTVTEDEVASTVIALSVDPADVSEGAAATEITVTAKLNSGSRSSATVVTVTVGGSTTVSALSVTGATVTITDDDGTPTVTLELSPASISEDGGESAVTAKLSHASSDQTTVEVSATPVSPAVAADYALSTNVMLTIAAGAKTSTGAVTVTGVDNDVDAADKSVTVSGAADNERGVTDPADVTLTLADDDERGVEVKPTTLAVPEGGEKSYTVVLESEPTGDVEVTVTRKDGGSGDVTVSLGSLTFTATTWEEAQTVKVSAVHDLDAVQDTATIEHGVSGGDYGSESADEVAVTVTEDEVASTVIALSVDPADVSEGAAATEITVTAKLNSGSRSSATVVTVTVGTGTATSGTDFTAVADLSLTIAADATGGTGTFRLSPTQDTVDEPDETVAVGGSTTVSALSVTGATVTITDDDGTPTVTLELSPASISEDGGESAVTAKLSHASSDQTTVEVSATPVSPAESEDYALSTNVMLTIAAGAKTSTGAVTVTGVDNDVDAADKSVTVSGAADNERGVTDPADVTLTLADDDERGVGVKPTTLAVPEGGEKSYTVVLESEPTGDVEVTVTRKDGGSGDVTVSLGSLTFTATTWEEAQTVKVSAKHDLDAVCFQPAGDSKPRQAGLPERA